MFQEVAPDTAALKQAVAALLGGGVQLEQITVTVSLGGGAGGGEEGGGGTGRRLAGGVNTTTALAAWLVSVQVAFEGVLTLTLTTP